MNALIDAYGKYCWTLGQATVIFGPVYDVIWPVLGLLPLALGALAWFAIRPAAQSAKATHIARSLLVAQPALWLLACIIFIPFWSDMRTAQPKTADIIGYIHLGLIATLAVAGIAAFVVVKGWNRLTAALLTVVNLWLILMCCFIGIMAVSGVWL